MDGEMTIAQLYTGSLVETMEDGMETEDVVLKSTCVDPRTWASIIERVPLAVQYLEYQFQIPVWRAREQLAVLISLLYSRAGDLLSHTTLVCEESITREYIPETELARPRVLLTRELDWRKQTDLWDIQYDVSASEVSSSRTMLESFLFATTGLVANLPNRAPSLLCIPTYVAANHSHLWATESSEAEKQEDAGQRKQPTADDYIKACLAVLTPWNLPKMHERCEYGPQKVIAECSDATKSQIDALAAITVEASRPASTRQHPSFYIEGGAGVGKSWTIRAICRIFDTSSVILTATTGAAAMAIDMPYARTVHSTLGIGDAGRDAFKALIRNLERYSTTNYSAHLQDSFRDFLATLKTTGALGTPIFILDEVSMLGTKTLDMAARSWLLSNIIANPVVAAKFSKKAGKRGLATLFTQIRDNIQDVSSGRLTETEETEWWIKLYQEYWRYLPIFICVGDFYQLEPVKDKHAFHSPWWKNAMSPSHLSLIEQMRQGGAGTSEYVDFLNKLRVGQASQVLIKRIIQRMSTPIQRSRIGHNPHHLVARNDKAESINNEMLKRLNRPIYKIAAIDQKSDDHQLRQFSCVLETAVQVAVGARTILRRNLDLSVGLVNSATLRIVGVALVTAPPAGSQQDAAWVDPLSEETMQKNVFEGLPVWAASPPLRTNAYIWLDHEDPARLKPARPMQQGGMLSAGQTMLEVEVLKTKKRYILLPIKLELKQRPPRRIRNEQGELVVPQGEDTMSRTASRTQLPVSLGWAITFHRCQGATLDEVEMDGKGMFAHAQAYVAFSRVRSENCLYIIEPPTGTGCTPHPDVMEYYSTYTSESRRRSVIKPPDSVSL